MYEESPRKPWCYEKKDGLGINGLGWGSAFLGSVSGSVTDCM